MIIVHLVRLDVARAQISVGLHDFHVFPARALILGRWEADFSQAHNARAAVLQLGQELGKHGLREAALADADAYVDAPRIPPLPGQPELPMGR